MKAIFFDFDGTLANTAPGIVCTMQETFKEMNLAVPSEKDIRQTIGLPLYDSIKMLGSLDDDMAQKGTDTYRKLFPTFEVTHISIFPGVAQTVADFASRGIRMAICTSRGRESLETILDHHGLLGYFETAVTNSDHLTPKPAPDMVLTLLDRMDLQKEDVIVVGDTTFDIEMGNGAGCRTVAVTYGNHSREKLMTANPTWMIDRFESLKDVI